MTELVQFHTQPGTIDLAWGHPDPAFLPTEAVAAATRRAVERYGADALGYGRPKGPVPYLEQVRRRLSEIDDRAPRIDELLLTAGNSWAIDQVVTLLTSPGDVILVESPTYHLALRIFRDHPVELVPVPSGTDGIDVAELRRSAADLRPQGKRPRLVYAVPTHGNPTGRLMPAGTRRELAQALTADDLLLVEDDAYRELTFDGECPPSVWSIAEPGRVIRLGSFSKSLAPGLRVGYLTAPSDVVERFADSGVVDSGGGVAHLASLVVEDFMHSGTYAPHVERLRTEYRQRRDALLEAIRTHLPDGIVEVVPRGGFFVWLVLPGIDTRRLAMGAAKEGVGFVPGPLFGFGEAHLSNALRLSFSLYPAALLEEAVVRLARAIAVYAGE